VRQDCPWSSLRGVCVNDEEQRNTAIGTVTTTKGLSHTYSTARSTNGHRIQQYKTLCIWPFMGCATITINYFLLVFLSFLWLYSIR
jgi:hypothetical protein